MLHAEKTERGWELADETGTFESLETSTVYRTRPEANRAAEDANFSERGFDEYRALESLVPPLS